MIDATNSTVNVRFKLLFPVFFALIAFAMVISFYYLRFNDSLLNADQAVWGQFGDYVGGTLNPLLAFFSFIALLYTINLQRQELSLSRHELARSAEAQTRTAEFAKSQNDITKKQLEILAQNEIKSDLYKIIESSERKVMDILNKEVNFSSTQGLVKIKKILAMIENDDVDDFRISEAKNALKDDLDEIAREVNVIMQLSKKFTELAGHNHLESYYESLLSRFEKRISKLINHGNI